MEHVPLAFIAELVFPPMKWLDQSLKELYMEISGRHGFTSFRLIPGGGADMRTDSGKECRVLRDKILYRDERTEHASEDFCSELSALTSSARKRLRIPVFLTQSVVVRALIRIHESQSARKFLDANLLGLDPEKLQAFGRKAAVPTMGLIFPTTKDNPSEFRVRIEPYFQDPRMLFVENSARFLAPIQTDEQVEAQAMAACDFLRGPLLNFLSSHQGPS